MSRHGGGGYEELDYEADQPVSVWRPEFAGVLVPEGQKESLREAATATIDEHGQRYCPHGVYLGYLGGPDFMCSLCEIGDEPLPLECDNLDHGDCGPLVEIDETGRHCHENEDGRCWHEPEGGREGFLESEGDPIASSAPHVHVFTDVEEDDGSDSGLESCECGKLRDGKRPSGDSY